MVSGTIVKLTGFSKVYRKWNSENCKFTAVMNMAPNLVSGCQGGYEYLPSFGWDTRGWEHYAHMCACKRCTVPHCGGVFRGGGGDSPDYSQCVIYRTAGGLRQRGGGGRVLQRATLAQRATWCRVPSLPLD